MLGAIGFMSQPKCMHGQFSLLDVIIWKIFSMVIVGAKQLNAVNIRKNDLNRI